MIVQVNDETIVGSYGRSYNRINYTVAVNFEQSSYEVMEDRGEVTIDMELSKSSFKPFEVMITIMNVTANCKCTLINYNYHLNLLSRWRGL